jgi:RNA polymerase sigma factor (sigma-70 family)
MDDLEFGALLERVRAGDEGAVAALLKAYEPEVRMMVRARLPHVLRKRLESQDITQSIWVSLLTDDDGRARLEFASPRQFLAYVAGVARLKVLEKYRQHTQTKKYDLAREEPLAVRSSGSGRAMEPASADPSPSQYVQADDLMAQLAAGRSPEEVLALQLRRQGLTFEEIGARVGLSEKTARRLIESLRARMEARQWE